MENAAGRRIMSPPYPAASLMLFILLCYTAANMFAVEGFSVTEAQVNGESLWTINHPDYQVSITPAQGAVIKSFILKPEGTEATYFSEGEFSGLIQEVHTAETPYQLIEKRIREEKSVFVFSTSQKNYGVEKRMIFHADSPFIEIEATFENYSDLARRGHWAPAFSHLFRPTEPARTGTASYYIGEQYGTSTYTERSILTGLHPLLTGSRFPVPWLAVIDPVAERGVGLVFPDSAVENISAGRNTKGYVKLHTHIRALPGNSRLVTRMLLLPLSDFPSVDFISRNLIANTSHRKFAGTEKLYVQIKSLMADEHDLSIVTRAYDSQGRELGPLETLVFEGLSRIKAPESQEIKIEGSLSGKVAWVRHEAYLDGRRLDQYIVRLGALATFPDLRASEAPEPEIEKLEEESKPQISEKAEDNEDAAISVSHLSGMVWDKTDQLNTYLTENELFTLILRVESKEDVHELQAGILGAGANNEGEEPSSSLSASNVFIWEVIEPDSPNAVLRPFRKKDMLDAQTPFYFAITLNTGALEPGRYDSRIVVSSAAETIEIPLTVRVYPVNLCRYRGYALWHIGGSISEWSGTVAENAARHSVKAMSFHLDAGHAPRQIDRMIARIFGDDIITPGFYSPGMSAVYAEKMREIISVSDNGPAHPQLTWLLCAGADDPADAGFLGDIGFRNAFFISRFSPSAAEKLLEEAAGFRYVLAGGDIPVESFWRADATGDPKHNEPLPWRYIDLRPYHWMELSVLTRMEFFNSMLSGAAGAAVRVEPPSGSTTEQLLLWHLLRDIRLETAMLALALDRGNDTEVPDKLRDEILAMVSDDSSANIRQSIEPGAFGKAARLHISGYGSHNSVQQMRRLCLEILSAGDK